MHDDVPDLVRQHAAQLATDAYALETRIKAHTATIRVAWVGLAQALHEFDDMQGWRVLGYDRLAQWLASPEIEMSRSQYFALVTAWRVLVIERAVPPGELAKVDITKAQDILPAVRRGDVSATQALADAEHLGRHDLREKYRAPVEGNASTDDFIWDICHACGSRVRILID